MQPIVSIAANRASPVQQVCHRLARGTCSFYCADRLLRNATCDETLRVSVRGTALVATAHFSHVKPREPALSQTGAASGLPVGTSMNTSTRVGPSVLADPCVEWTAPAGSKNVFPAGTICSGSLLMANAS